MTNNRPSGFANPWLQLALSVVCVLASELLLKRGASNTANPASACSFQNAGFVARLSAGILSMTISFFLTLGLLQHFDLSYLYPFQGLSIIIISLLAALILKEKLTWQLTIGAVLITAGVVLVSLT